MKSNKIFVTASFLLILMGCKQSQNSTTQATSPTTTINTPQVVKLSPTPSPEVATPTPATSPSVVKSSPTATPKALILKPPASKEQLISAEGIGVAKVGMTKSGT